MDRLIQLLQNNPMIILAMFIISILSGIITIILGWKRFRDDILLKKITLPVYAYLVILFLVALAIIFWPAIEDRPKRLRSIKGESFGVQRVFVDGKRFVNCTFRNTELVFRGEGTSSVEGCRFINIRFAFDGPAATTVGILRDLYAEPNFRPFVENTLKAIREGNLPVGIPPSDAADE